MMEESNAVWLSERVMLIKEFKDDRDPLPPPFNLIALVFYDAPSCLWAVISRAQSDPAKRGFKLLVRRRMYGETNNIAKLAQSRYLKGCEKAHAEQTDEVIR